MKANQCRGSFEAIYERMSAYLDFFHNWALKFEKVSITHKPQNNVRHVDALAFFLETLEVDRKRIVEVER